MVMDGRHLEDPFAGEFKGNDLHDNRQGFDNEETADDGKNDLVLDRDRNRPKRAAERERTRISHEDLCGRRVEPKKAQTGADQGTANDGELARAGNEINPEVSRE